MYRVGIHTGNNQYVKIIVLEKFILNNFWTNWQCGLSFKNLIKIQLLIAAYSRSFIFPISQKHSIKLSINIGVINMKYQFSTEYENRKAARAVTVLSVEFWIQNSRRMDQKEITWKIPSSIFQKCLKATQTFQHQLPSRSFPFRNHLITKSKVIKIFRHE